SQDFVCRADGLAAERPHPPQRLWADHPQPAMDTFLRPGSLAAIPDRSSRPGRQRHMPAGLPRRREIRSPLDAFQPPRLGLALSTLAGVPPRWGPAELLRPEPGRPFARLCSSVAPP